MYFRLCGTAFALSTLSLLGCEQQYVCIASDAKSCGLDMSNVLSGTNVDSATKPNDMTEIRLGGKVSRAYILLTNQLSCSNKVMTDANVYNLVDQIGAKLQCPNDSTTCAWTTGVPEGKLPEPKSVTLSVNMVIYGMSDELSMKKVCFSVDGSENCEDITSSEIVTYTDASWCKIGTCWKLIKKNLPLHHGNATSVTLRFDCRNIVTLIQNPELILQY